VTPDPVTPTTPALRVTGLTRRFGSTVALDGVDLVVAPGEVRGLLGPNGAGKTTLLRLLFGLLAADAGTIELFGRVAGEPRAVVGERVAGFVEEPRFYPYLTGRANLEVLADLDGDGTSSAIQTALGRVGLSGRADDRVSGYSTGMRQRLGIAAALLRAPRLLLLDEPTSGLDPEGVRDTSELIRELSAEGVAVLLSSHQIGEVEGICDTFTMIRRGRVVWDGTSVELRRQAPGSPFRLVTSNDRVAMEMAGRHRALGITRAADGGLRVTATEEEVDAFVLDIAAAGVAVRRLDVLMSPLEAMFFALTDDHPAPDLRRAATSGRVS
jgi:ABC-2 type transport system ATP-binding protein